MLSRWSSKSTRLEVLKDGKAQSGSAVAFSSSTHVQDDNSTMKYIIAGSVLATCVGNMFIMRSRLKSMSKWRAPTARKSDGWAHPSPSNMYENAHVTKENLRGPNTPAGGQHSAAEPFPPATSMRAKLKEMNPRMRDRFFLDKWATWKKSGFKDDALRPNFITGSTIADGRSFANYLRNLEMRTDTVPSVDEVKFAYRALARELHPDANRHGGVIELDNDENEEIQEKNTQALTRAKEAQDALVVKLRNIDKCPRL